MKGMWNWLLINAILILNYMKARSCNANLVPAKWRERLAISVNQKSFPDTESFDCQTKTSVLACLHMAIGL